MAAELGEFDLRAALDRRAPSTRDRGRAARRRPESLCVALRWYRL
jgi:hypothetical protein